MVRERELLPSIGLMIKEYQVRTINDHEGRSYRFDKLSDRRSMTREDLELLLQNLYDFLVPQIKRREL